MAGSFGFEAEHYGLSQQIGELVLFPALRQLDAQALVCAPGTSCRHQIGTPSAAPPSIPPRCSSPRSAPLHPTPDGLLHSWRALLRRRRGYAHRATPPARPHQRDRPTPTKHTTSMFEPPMRRPNLPPRATGADGERRPPWVHDQWS